VNDLRGCRVLLVEDESLIAMLAEDMLLDLGCEVVVAMRFDRALNHARTERFDLAVLDINLGDARSYPIADLLHERGVPFLFATGYEQRGLDQAYQAVPVLQKPYQQAQMQFLLGQLLTCERQHQLGDMAPQTDCDCRKSSGIGFRAEPSS
jgi:CheY-like chemotaxis protein